MGVNCSIVTPWRTSVTFQPTAIDETQDLLKEMLALLNNGKLPTLIYVAVSVTAAEHNAVNIHKLTQGNRRLHFARAAHSYHPFRADPICSKRGSNRMIPSAA